MKAPPQALEGPGEEPSWHLFLVSVTFGQGARQLPCDTWEWPGTYKIAQIVL